MYFFTYFDRSLTVRRRLWAGGSTTITSTLSPTTIRSASSPSSFPFTMLKYTSLSFFFYYYDETWRCWSDWSAAFCHRFLVEFRLVDEVPLLPSLSSCSLELLINTNTMIFYNIFLYLLLYEIGMATFLCLRSP